MILWYICRYWILIQLHIFEIFGISAICLKMFWISAILLIKMSMSFSTLLFKLIFVFTHMFLFFSLGPLVNKVKEFQVETIVDTLCSNMISDKEQLRDISSIGKLLLALSFTLYLYPDLSFSMTFTVYFRVEKIYISQ